MEVRHPSRCRGHRWHVPASGSPAGDLTQFRLAVNRLCNPARHDQRFEGHTGQNIHRFGITLPFTEQNADSAGPTAVNRHVQISDADVLAVFGRLLYLKQPAHLLDRLIECSGLRVVMQPGIRAMMAVDQTDGHGDGQRIAFFNATALSRPITSWVSEM